MFQDSKHKSIKSAISIAMVIVASYGIEAQANLCATKTADGKTAFMYINNAKPLAYLAATVKNLPACKTNANVTVEAYKVPNPVNECEKQAVLACEPSFKGLPVGHLSEMEHFCGFVFVTTQQGDNSESMVRYVNGQPYDGTKYVSPSAQTCARPITK